MLVFHSGTNHFSMYVIVDEIRFLIKTVFTFQFSTLSCRFLVVVSNQQNTTKSFEQFI